MEQPQTALDPAPPRRGGHARPTIDDRLMLGRIRTAIDVTLPELTAEQLHEVSRRVYTGLRDLVPVGEAWADTLPEPDRAHVARSPWQMQCPECGDPVNLTGLPELVYTFEVCDCGDPDFVHLIERLWHRDCFTAAHRDPVHDAAHGLLLRLLGHANTYVELDNGALYLEGAATLTDTEAALLEELQSAIRASAPTAPSAPAAGAEGGQARQRLMAAEDEVEQLLVAMIEAEGGQG